MTAVRSVAAVGSAQFHFLFSCLVPSTGLTSFLLTNIAVHISYLLCAYVALWLSNRWGRNKTRFFAGRWYSFIPNYTHLQLEALLMHLCSMRHCVSHFFSFEFEKVPWTEKNQTPKEKRGTNYSVFNLKNIKWTSIFNKNSTKRKKCGSE